MIYRYRGLVIVFSVLLAAAGGFFIYDSMTNSRSYDLNITVGACCCSLALILFFKLATNLRDPCAPDETEQPESNPQRHT